MDQRGCSAFSFASPLTGHSTCSRPSVGRVHAFYNIFLRAVTLRGHTLCFTVGFEPWQLGDTHCSHYLCAKILTGVQPSLKCCGLAACAVPPPLHFCAQSCHHFCSYEVKYHGTWVAGFEEQRIIQHKCVVLYKNQISWLSHACLKITPMAWELNSSLPSKEMPEQTRESYYPGFVSLHVPCVWFQLEHKEKREGYEEEIIMIW